MKNPEQKVEFTRGNNKKAPGEKYGHLSYLDTDKRLTISQCGCIQKVKCLGGFFVLWISQSKKKDVSSFGSLES